MSSHSRECTQVDYHVEHSSSRQVVGHSASSKSVLDASKSLLLVYTPVQKLTVKQERFVTYCLYKYLNFPLLTVKC